MPFFKKAEGVPGFQCLLCTTEEQLLFSLIMVLKTCMISVATQEEGPGRGPSVCGFCAVFSEWLKNKLGKTLSENRFYILRSLLPGLRGRGEKKKSSQCHRAGGGFGFSAGAQTQGGTPSPRIGHSPLCPWAEKWWAPKKITKKQKQKTKKNIVRCNWILFNLIKTSYYRVMLLDGKYKLKFTSVFDLTKHLKLTDVINNRVT